MIADRQAELEEINATFEQSVDLRTKELRIAVDALNNEIDDR